MNKPFKIIVLTEDTKAECYTDEEILEKSQTTIATDNVKVERKKSAKQCKGEVADLIITDYKIDDEKVERIIKPVVNRSNGMMMHLRGVY